MAGGLKSSTEETLTHHGQMLANLQVSQGRLEESVKGMVGDLTQISSRMNSLEQNIAELTALFKSFVEGEGQAAGEGVGSYAVEKPSQESILVKSTGIAFTTQLPHNNTEHVEDYHRDAYTKGNLKLMDVVGIEVSSSFTVGAEDHFPAKKEQSVAKHTDCSIKILGEEMDANQSGKDPSHLAVLNPCEPLIIPKVGCYQIPEMVDEGMEFAQNFVDNRHDIVVETEEDTPMYYAQLGNFKLWLESLCEVLTVAWDPGGIWKSVGYEVKAVVYYSNLDVCKWFKNDLGQLQSSLKQLETLSLLAIMSMKKILVTGPLPDSLGSLSNLRVLVLSHNHLLSNLQVIELEDNPLGLQFLEVAAALSSSTPQFTLTIFIFILLPVGVFYPYNRGALFTALFVIYALTSVIAGYSASSSYCQLEGANWMGMGRALETLCGQVFGAGQVHLLGTYMQLLWIILIVYYIIITPLYILATPILKLVGQDKVVVELVEQFTILIIPKLFSLAFNFPNQKFLQAQSKVAALAGLGLLCLIQIDELSWLFIYKFGWVMTGASIAMDLKSWANGIAQLFYIVYWCEEGRNEFSWEASSKKWGFVRLSLASAVKLCLEVGYMMSIVSLTDQIDNAVIAVGFFPICMNINGFERMVFIGVNAEIQGSNELGLGQARAAKYAVHVTVFQSFRIGLTCIVLILARNNHFCIIRPIVRIWWAIGGGWLALVAYLGCYYGFWLPLGVFFSFCYTANLGVQGLWEGMLAGNALQALLLLFILYRTNWMELFTHADLAAITFSNMPFSILEDKDDLKEWGL